MGSNAKKILFEIEIEGSEAIIRTQNQLAAAIKQTNSELGKAEFGTEAYRKLEAQLAQLKAKQQDVADSAAIVRREFEVQAVRREFEVQAGAAGKTYRSLNAELVNARKLFKDLTEEERKGQLGQDMIKRIKELDKELKDIDATVGQFQRNVGNYPQQFSQMIGGVLPGFGQLQQATQLVNQGMGQIGQTAGGLNKLLAGAFIGFQVGTMLLDGIAQVNAYTKEITKLRGELDQMTSDTQEATDEATANIVAMSATFGEGTEQLKVAAISLANTMGISINEATDLISQGFLAGANANGEYLDVLREYPKLFDEMGFSAKEFIAIQTKASSQGIYSDKGVDAVKEFGLRIREQTDATKGALEEAFGEPFTKKLLDGVNKGEVTQAEALKRIAGRMKETEIPAKQLGQVVADVFGGPGEDAGVEFLKSLADVGTAIEDGIEAGGAYTQMLRDQYEAEQELAAAKVQVSKEIISLTGSTATLGTQLETFGTQIIGGLVWNINQLRIEFETMGRNVRVNFELLANGFEKLYLYAKKYNPFAALNGEQVDAVNSQIKALDAESEAWKKQYKSFAQAKAEAANEAAELQKAVEKKAADDAAEKAKAQQASLNQKAREAREKEAAKIRAEHEKDIKTATDAELKLMEEKDKLLAELAKRLADQSIAAIQNQTEREIAQERQKYDQLLTELQQQEDKLLEQQKDAREKVVEAYGEKSAEIAAFDAKAASDLEAQRDAAAQVEAGAAEARERKIGQIRLAEQENQHKQQLEALKKQLDDRQKSYDEAQIRAKTDLDQAITDVLNSSLKASDKKKAIITLEVKANVAQIEAEQQKVYDQIAALNSAISDSEASGAFLTDASAYTSQVAQLEALYGKHAELERKKTEATQTESERRKQITKEEYSKQAEKIGKTLETFGQIADIAGQVGATITARQLAGLDEQDAAHQDNIRRYEERMQTASAAEKALLQKKIDAEKKALEKLDKEREAIEKKDARRAKAMAIIQSIINTAVAVTKVLANPFLAATTAAFGLAQTAIIAAQPAAQGGRMGMVQPYEMRDGLIVSASNIPTMRNGDDVLATLKRGEVVLNKRQQALLGGAPTFKSIGVPGFASGGIVGNTRIGAPDISGSLNAERIRKLEQISEQLVNLTTATLNRVDNIRVHVVSEDIQSDLQEGASIAALATLG